MGIRIEGVVTRSGPERLVYGMPSRNNMAFDGPVAVDSNANPWIRMEL